MASLAVVPEAPLPYDLANVPADYWERATSPDRLRDMKIGGKGEIYPIPPSIIKIDPNHNPRDYRLPENRAHLDDLKRKIKAAGGVIRPLECRWDFFAPGDTTKSIIVVDGECRLRSVWELIAEGMEILSVDVKQSDAKTEEQRLLDALMLNEGKPLSQWELGNAFKRFRRMGWPVEKIVERTGHTNAFITHAIEMADAPEEVKEMLSAQAVTPSHAIAILREQHPDRAVETLRTDIAEHKAAGKKGPVKRAKATSPKAGQDAGRTSQVLLAAEAMAQALDLWKEDATTDAEQKLLEAHKAYRKLIRAPKQEEEA